MVAENDADGVKTPLPLTVVVAVALNPKKAYVVVKVAVNWFAIG